MLKWIARCVIAFFLVLWMQACLQSPDPQSGGGKDSVAVRIDTMIVIHKYTLIGTVHRIDTVYKEGEILKVIETLKLDTVIKKETIHSIDTL